MSYLLSSTHTHAQTHRNTARHMDATSVMLVSLTWMSRLYARICTNTHTHTHDFPPSHPFSHTYVDTSFLQYVYAVCKITLTGE